MGTVYQFPTADILLPQAILATVGQRPWQRLVFSLHQRLSDRFCMIGQWVTFGLQVLDGEFAGIRVSVVVVAWLRCDGAFVVDSPG